MDKKYELTNETISIDGKTLYRIRALRDFGTVKAGDLGGYIESEYNLNHSGDCWIYGSAMVYDSAIISDSARVFDSVCIFDSARVYGSARVSGWARVYASARVFDSVCIFDSARVYDSARVSGSARLKNNDEIFKTEHYCVIQGVCDYPITVTPMGVNVGCKSFTFDRLNTDEGKEDFPRDYKRIHAAVEIALDRILEKIWKN